MYSFNYTKLIKFAYTYEIFQKLKLIVFMTQQLKPSGNTPIYSKEKKTRAYNLQIGSFL